MTKVSSANHHQTILATPPRIFSKDDDNNKKSNNEKNKNLSSSALLQSLTPPPPPVKRYTAASWELTLLDKELGGHDDNYFTKLEFLPSALFLPDDLDDGENVPPAVPSSPSSNNNNHHRHNNVPKLQLKKKELRNEICYY